MKGTRRSDVLGASTDELVRLVALPTCRSAHVRAIRAVDRRGDSRTLPSDTAQIEGLGRIREQTVAILTVNGWTATGGGRLEIDVEVVGTEGPASRPAGPFTEPCRRTVHGYRPSDVPRWRPPSANEQRSGTATYCSSAAECAAAGVDFLFVVASDFAYSPVVYALATHHASYLGLNVGIVPADAVGERTPEALKSFLQAVYDSESAEHFSDSRLGFVLLIGDAYADDNQTVMIPAYNGYGGNEEASDHYYACLSGDDDFEDVMLGRLPVGNLEELIAVVGKAANYMPLPESGEWRDSSLLIGGLFYTTKDEYVQLFDDYEDLHSDGMTVDRIYRHDFQNDAQCAAEVVDELNEGHLFATFVGDGWIHSWHRTMTTSHIPLLENTGRLPIVLSMACMTGWFDNTTEADQNGSYDCFAEQLVNRESAGAIACFAAPRPTDGGVYPTLTEEIYSAAYEEHCVYLGDLFATAKLKHLVDGGQQKYVRHFNLLGDPALVFAWDEPPTTRPDLVVRPHEVTIEPQYPATTDELTVSLTVSNQSAVDTGPVTLEIAVDGPGGYFTDDVLLLDVPAWSDQEHALTVPSCPAGACTLSVTIDPDNVVDEIDEENNGAWFGLFVYDSLEGFPVDLGTDPCAPGVVSGPDGTPTIVVQGSDGRLSAIAPDGTVDWQSDPATPPLDFGPEIATATGDLDADGEAETAVLRRMGAAAYGADGSELWTKNTDDPIGRPAIADADGDGDGDVILSTWNMFGGESRIIAVDEAGSTIWSWTVPNGERISTAPVVGDLDLDGRADVVCGTQAGAVRAVTLQSGEPEELWSSPPSLGGNINTLALADIDEDGFLEILVGCDDIVALSGPTGTVSWSYELDSAVVSIAVGSVDADSAGEVVVGTVSGTVYRIDDGTPLWGINVDAVARESFVIADVDGDGDREIVLAVEQGDVIILEPDGSRVAEPIPIPGGAHTPYVADLDGDGAIELCVAGETGLVFALDLTGAAGDVAWAGLGARASRTGLLRQPFSGEIAGSVVLTGEYEITATVSVPEGADLTLAAGTQFVFDSGPTGLVVNGSVTAQGTASRPVVLRSADARGEWAGLTMYEGSSASLTNCRIEDATFGIRGQQATVTLDAVQIDDVRFGTDLSGTVFTATDCVFSNADSSGVRLTSGSSGTIRDCTLTGNAKRGIELRNQTSCHVVSTLISGVSEGHGIACTRSSHATIDSCTITDNGMHGVLASGSSPWIRFCTITDNEESGIHVVKQGYPRIARSTIADNSIGISVEAASSAMLGGYMYPDTGYNAITGNTRAAVANYNGSDPPVYARWNWWGSPTPYGRLFVGYVIHTPWLDAPPDERPGPVHEKAPVSFTLHPNAPNPFNPVTTIRLSVPAGGGDVDLTIYDVSGRRVMTLHSGHLDAGEHRLTWSGTDDLGKTVASGVYFARMVAPGYTHSVRMLLLK